MAYRDLIKILDGIELFLHRYRQYYTAFLLMKNIRGGIEHLINHLHD